MKIRIHCDRESLEKSLMCGAGRGFQHIGKSCWIAIAVRDVFPKAYVEAYHMIPFYLQGDHDLSIPLPHVASAMIAKFDSLYYDPLKRLNLQPFSFEIEVPEEVINAIGINEVERILSESKTLEKV